MRRQINSEELDTLYSLIGQGIWQLQDVEDVLNTTITIKRDVKVRGSVTFEQAEAILLKHRKNTLGISLKIARESEIFSPTLQKRLDIFKKERDWLVHNCVHEH